MFSFRFWIDDGQMLIRYLVVVRRLVTFLNDVFMGPFDTWHQ